jgi:hypothetical protein
MGWEPPRYEPGPAPSSEDWNSIAQQVARLSRRQGPGIYNGAGNFPDDGDDSVSTKRVFLTMQDAMLPGTFDLPGEGYGLVMVKSGSGRMSASSTRKKVVNYSTSIYAPIGGGVIAEDDGSGTLIALASFN